MCFRFILNLFLGSTKPCKCCWKCAIIKVALIGDTVTFCSAQITARAIHKAWHLCLLWFFLFSLARTELFFLVIKLSFVCCCRPRVSMEVINIASFSVQTSLQQLAAHVHACNRKMDTRAPRVILYGQCRPSLGLGDETALISVITGEKMMYFVDLTNLFLLFCTFSEHMFTATFLFVRSNTTVYLYVFVCVNHTSTERSIQFLMGPPGLHSSSLLIFSCFPFCTPRGWDVSIGPGRWRRVWAIDKQIEDEGKSKGEKNEGKERIERKRGGSGRRGLRAPWSQRPWLTPDLDHDLRGYPRGQRLCESATAAIHSTAGWWWSYAASPACLTWSVFLSACGSQGPHIHL